ncbi:outer membrane lipoprotein carrier protein LolA [Pseudonocardia bannensis]|uniref:Outer membrane lipoprotein carrier protein LolA n=1 Tax=Pseudonocardia bannensis TaxID=630973 RepID=A0A848DGB8_9PSEU|nr:outer membrane lipoprotein carrier protein LolA [Pseudonocardia bannensis]
MGLLATPAGAGAAPELPPVSPEDLVSSVIAARHEPFAGTVELDNALGLPPLPQLPQAADGTSTARVWSGGEHQGRLSLPTAQGERTIVTDGTTLWSWDSADRTVTRRPIGERQEARAATDPTAAATQAIEMLRSTSAVTVDGTAEVAGRPAYELVLAPAPTERTLLREVRIAVDAEKRMPLRFSVLATGSAEPALQVGFTDLTFGAQDPSLFTFTPPPGATVTAAEPKSTSPAPGAPATSGGPTVVGDGWDTVVIAKAPAEGRESPDLSSLGTPVSGSWGSGRLITTAVATAIVTDDGRIAAGAVPEQVLTEALST